MYGVTVWEMLSFGSLPWGSQVEDDITAGIRKGTTLPRPNGCPSDIFHLMVGCWDLEPEERPSATRLSEFLDEFDRAPYASVFLKTDAALDVALVPGASFGKSSLLSQSSYDIRYSLALSFY